MSNLNEMAAAELLSSAWARVHELALDPVCAVATTDLHALALVLEAVNEKAENPKVVAALDPAPRQAPTRRWPTDETMNSLRTCFGGVDQDEAGRVMVGRILREYDPIIRLAVMVCRDANRRGVVATGALRAVYDEVLAAGLLEPS